MTVVTAPGLVLHDGIDGALRVQIDGLRQLSDAERAVDVTPTNYSYLRTPERFGAVGDGVTDDTSALQQWASVNSAREMFDTVYKCNDILVFAHPVLRGLGSGRSVIDYSGATGGFSGNRCVDFGSSGSFVALPGLNGGLTVGVTTTITFVSAHGLAVGAVIRIQHTTLWSGFLSTFTQGEFCVVAEVTSANVIVITAPLYDSYTSGATVTRFDYSPVHIEGVSFIGVGPTSGVQTLFITNAAHATVRDVAATNSGLIAVSLRHSFDVHIEGLTAHQYTAVPTPGAAQYGLAMIHVQDVRAQGNFQGQRHAVTTGSTTGGGVVNRAVLVHDSQLQSLIRPAGDFHGNTEWSAYDNCVLRGGVALGGNHNAIRNSTLIGHANIGAGYVVTGREMRGFDFQLENLMCRTLGNPQADGGHGVIDIGGDDECLTADTTQGGTFRIQGVDIYAPNALAGTRMVNRGCTQAMTLMVNGLDQQINASTASSFGLLRMDALSGSDFAKVSTRQLTGTGSLGRSTINWDVTTTDEE